MKILYYALCTISAILCVGMVSYVVIAYIKSGAFVSVFCHTVRHGRWIEVKGFTGVEAFGYREECVEGFACSVCGKEVDVSEGDFHYCPNCGATMDLEDKNGN